MFCTSCGQELPENARVCPQCGTAVGTANAPAPAAAVAPVEKPGAGSLICAILVTMFCCLPLGVVGIVYATKANGYADAGDRARMLEAAKKARMWTLIGFIAGFISILLSIGVQIIVAIASVSFEC